MLDMNLLEETRDLLARSSLTLEQISEGSNVSIRWLGYLRAGTADPVFSKLSRVNDFLKQQETACAA